MAPINKPLAVGHLLMDWKQTNGSWADVQTKWSSIRFDAVDVLNVSPFIVQPDRQTFGLDFTKPDIETLFKWVVSTARTKNPNIKIFAQQFWGSTAWILLDTSHIQTYAKSVASVIQKYGLDGYDVDYEWNSRNGSTIIDPGNQIPEAPAILAAVRHELDAISTANKPLYLTLSPASVEQLTSENLLASKNPVSKSVDWVNIQTYDGGSNGLNEVQSWLDLGFNSSQLLYGIWPETTDDPKRDSPTLANVKTAYTSGKLGGINLWRLTSGCYVFESQVQVLVYNFLHGTTLKDTPNSATVEGAWHLKEDDKIAQFK